ncbi:MAG: PHB depolymerase family esterase [Gammaproteobacteria bacterium]|nr:PHB depolymerase family esterase [Gammaproteobacteria bacterium]
MTEAIRTRASFSNAAGTRAYEVYAPPSRKPGPRPSIVMLHGCTQGPEDFAVGTRMNALADLHDFVVVYPAQSPAANAMRCWNWFAAGDQERDRGEPSLVAGIARQVAERHALDRQRIYIAGFSAGAAMAVVLADAYGDLFAARAVHSGIPFAARPRAAATHALPTIVFHGDADANVNVAQGAEIVRQAAAREEIDGGALRVTTRRSRSAGGLDCTVTSYRRDASRPRIEFWLVHGAGHAWFGGSPAGSYTEARGPDASAEMVRFFGLSA